MSPISAAENALENQLIDAGLVTFVRELKFAPPRRWRFDFAWPGRRLAVEVEGGVYVTGRHSRGIGFEKDVVKYNTAILKGWQVMRVTPGQVRSGQALEWIRQALSLPMTSTDLSQSGGTPQ